MIELRLLAVGVLLAAAPMAGAHVDGMEGIPKPYCDADDREVHDYGPPMTGWLLMTLVDGNLADCDLDDIPADPDGHSEFALGGAWLFVTSGDGGYGSLACFGETGHHPLYGPINATDVSAPSGVRFVVGVDTESVIPSVDPSAPECGDNLIDHSVECVDSCTVDFPPGVDGAYHVFTYGLAGHVYTPAT